MAMEVRTPERDLRALRADLGLSQESFSRALDVSARSVERWEAKGTTTADADTGRRVALLSEILRLAREVYGNDVLLFLSTPRRSLGQRTPKEALVRGDLEAVRLVLIRSLEGDWA